MSIADKKLNLLVAAIASTVVAAPGYAQNESDYDNKLETTVVVGSTTNTLITPEDLERQQANDLADVFRHIPSVNVGGSIGIAQKIYVRGMEDTLLNVTVDGAPQTSTLFHHIGRVSIEPELLQQVEVQAGAGEATAGSGAIGGAIRFKTKSAEDLLSGSDKNFGAIIKANHFSNNGTKGSMAAYGKITDNVGILGSYVSVDRENMNDGSGNEIYGTAVKQSLSFLKVNADITENQAFALSYETRDESGDLGTRPNWLTLEDDPLYPMDGERKTLVVNYSADINSQLNLEFSLYDTRSELIQDGRFGLYSGETHSTGFDLRNTTSTGKHTITYGIERRDDEVNAGPRGDSIQDYIDEGLATNTLEEGQVLGLYVQDHWQISDPLLLSFGLRYDSYDLDKVDNNQKVSSEGFNPNIGLIYTLNDHIKLVAGHAQAMRGKEIGDSFTIADATIDADLEAENVNNTEFGIEYENDVVLVSATVYESRIDNVIQDQLGASTYYENIGELKTSGFEVSTHLNLDDLYLAASLSMNDSEINDETVEGYEHNGLGNARGDTFTLEAGYIFSSQWEAGWNFTYVRKLDNIEVLHNAVNIGWIDETQYITKPGYKFHDIYIKWSPLASDALTLNFAVQNLFNEYYRDHSSVADYSSIPGWEIVSGLYEAGRDIRLTASYTF